MSAIVNSNNSLANVDLRKDNFQMWLLNEGHLLKVLIEKSDSEFLPRHGQNCWNRDFSIKSFSLKSSRSWKMIIINYVLKSRWHGTKWSQAF